MLREVLAKLAKLVFSLKTQRAKPTGRGDGKGIFIFITNMAGRGIGVDFRGGLALFLSRTADCNNQWIFQIGEERGIFLYLFLNQEELQFVIAFLSLMCLYICIDSKVFVYFMGEDISLYLFIQ